MSTDGEKCQRCGETGEDRRTLWMACFYQMSELGLPFDEVQIRGTLTEKIGEEVSRFGNLPIFAEPASDAQRRNYKFYTLCVCKDCRASWMGAIGEWFKAPLPVRESCGSGIFVRKNGATAEITEEEWREMHPDGREPCRVTRAPEEDR